MSVYPDFAKRVFENNVTNTTHRTPYPAVDPTRPELSQKGRTVFITGGSAGIGFAIAKAFIRASAAAVIISGRRQHKLNEAIAALTKEAETAGTGTRVSGENVDVFDPEAIDKLWAGFAAKGIVIDVLILNAARMASATGPILSLGSSRVWETMEINARSLLLHTEKFHQQPKGDKPRAIINISTQAIHQCHKEHVPIVAERPEYSMTKLAGTMVMQYVALDADPDEVQILSYHPGSTYSEAWSSIGVPEEFMPFDDIQLPGNYAVWAASPEAKFLHGRFVWSSWDVDELANGPLRKRIDSEVDFLRVGIFGLRGENLA
ncbi:NAD(P)-binding protein [Echria macrotheca]|uniref:NAD(P)-binding protein n=1 Tax=Echria macrotheca TaxID=438768 RepID=A0AAJ0B993_9PEZI|nr:NAD(P)-binding protein [Echria macrotheca]